MEVVSTAIMGKALGVLFGPLKARRKYHLNRQRHRLS